MSTEEYLKRDLANPAYLEDWQEVDWKVWILVNRPVFEHPDFRTKILNNL